MSTNILFITCDQLRKDALGCYGNPVIHTPHIDSIADGGARFDNVFTAAPVCAPNRAAIATGRYPSVNGLRCNGMVLPAAELTMMEVFRRAGYATCGVGKMHFGPQWRRPGHPDDADFKTVEPNHALAVDPQPQPWEMPFYGFEEAWITEDHRIGPYADYLTKNGMDPWADPHSFTHPQHMTVRSAYPQEHHQTTWIGRKSAEFLGRQSADKPFFLWTSFVDPHHPFNPPAPFDTMYDPGEMPLPVREADEIQGWPEFYRRKYTATEGSHEAVGLCNLTDDDWRRIKSYYYGMVSLIDKQVGRLLDILRQGEMLDNTLVVFTSDHGELLGDHHLLFKGAHYDCVTQVPFLCSGPGVEGVSRPIEQIGRCVDIMPTVLELAHLPVPQAVQGKSLLPLLESPEAVVNEDAFIESGHLWTIRTPQTRLTWHGPARLGELYDLECDPHCFRNLWNDSDAAALRDKMLDRLVKHLVSNVDPLLKSHAWG